MTTRAPSADRGFVVYGSSLASRGGTGVYLRRLLQGFEEIGAECVSVALPGSLLSPREALLSAGRPGALKVFGEMVAAKRAAASAHPVLVHLPAFSGRAPRGAGTIVTVHDLAFLANPRWFPPVRRIYYRVFFPLVARRADLVITDSRFTAGELERLAGVPSGRTRTVYLSTPAQRGDPGRFRARLGIEGDYALSVSTIEPRKNIGALLDAWGTVAATRRDVRLVVCGRWGWGPRGILDRLRSSEGVTWTGPLGEEDLADAYSGARLLVYPSLYEGFGLPPLEAASAGVPSVLGPAGALREVYGSTGAAFCGPGPDSIAGAVLDALETERHPDALRDFASRFSNAEMARRTLECYREASV